MLFKKKKKNSKAFKNKFQKRFFTRSSVAVLAVGIVVFILAAGASIAQKRQSSVYDQQIRELESEIRGIEAENSRLEAEKSELNTDAFKEKIAREVLGMIGSDEYILKEETDASADEAYYDRETSEKKDSDKKKDSMT